MSNDGYVISWIGAKIRELRNNHGWKLSEFSSKSEVSIAMLSKIENGRVFPTFPTLIQILNTLNVDLNEFFADLQSQDSFEGHLVIRNQDYRELQKEDSSGFLYRNVLFKNISDISVEISILQLEPKAKRNLVSTEGFEYLYVLRGSVQYQLDDQYIELQEGDSLYFDGRTPHVPHNNTEDRAEILVIYLINQS